jgi:methionyl-tRNA formyltransferase
MSPNVSKDRLVYFGTDAFSVPPLVRLIAEKWSLVAVVTKPDKPTGRGRELSMPAVKRLAQAAGVPVLQPSKLADAATELTKLHAAAGIVVAYGNLIPPAMINLFPKGLINIHPSLLPRHRGASPIEAAILAGDDDTGVTLMQIERALDSGPTYDATKLQLTGTENRLELYEQLAEIGAELLAAKLPAILDGTIVAIPQDSSVADHTARLTKADGALDWTKSADVLEREIRAYLGWPSSHTQLAGVGVTITAARVSRATGHTGTAHRTPSGELAVYTGSGCLIIDRLKPAGKREMTGPEFLAGHKL